MAVDYPAGVRGAVICDPSLRLLNVKRQNPLAAPLVCVYGWIDIKMDGWMDGWMDGRMDGWIDGLYMHKYIHTCR